MAQYINLRNQRTNQTIAVWAPDRASAQAALHQRYPNGIPANVDIGPVGGPYDLQGHASAPAPAHPKSQDAIRSVAGGIAQGANAAIAPIGAAYDTEDHLAEMAAHGLHDAGHALGWIPQGAYQPGQGAAFMHTLRDPAELAAGLAGMFGADKSTQQGLRTGIHNFATVAAPGTLWTHLHPADVERAELSAARAAGGDRAANSVADVVDYVPQTGLGRALHRGASMLPAAALPGSLTQRVIAVGGPTLGGTIADEGARALGATPEVAANAELLGTLAGGIGGGRAVSPAETAVTNVHDIVGGPRAVPTSGRPEDLTAMLGGRPSGGSDFKFSDIPNAFSKAFSGGEAGGPGGPESAPTFRQSDLQGAASILKQHVQRVGRANGEDFDAMASRVGDMGGQAMLADAFPDLARIVADRGSYGQQFLGGQLNERQLGVRDPATGAWTAPSQSMRLQDAYARALGIPDGVAPFDYLKGIEDARNASAETNYKTAYAQPPVQVSAPPNSNPSPLWSNIANAQPAPPPDLPFSAYAESPVWQDAYARARKISGVEQVPNGDGTFSIQQLPEQMPEMLDWRSLDLMKRGVGDMVDAALTKGDTTYAGALSKYLERLTADQGELNAPLSEARADYAAPSQLMDAATLGSTFRQPTVHPAEVAWHLGQSDPNQVIGLQVGHYNSAQPVFDGSVRFNAAERLGATSPGAFEKDNLLIGDPDTAASWQQLLGNENTFANTRNRALGGSLSSRNLLGAEDAAEGESAGVSAPELAAGLLRAKAGDLDGFVETGANAGKLLGLSKLFQPKQTQMTEGAADVLGTILGTRGAFGDPQTVALVKALMESGKGPTFNFGVGRPAAVLSAPQSPDQGGNNVP